MQWIWFQTGDLYVTISITDYSDIRLNSIIYLLYSIFDNMIYLYHQMSIARTCNF